MTQSLSNSIVESPSVLVTAVGSDVGLSLVKALRLCARVNQIVGCDSEADDFGSAFVDSYFQAPPVSLEREYLAVLSEACIDFGIHAVFPGSEAELRFFASSSAQYTNLNLPVRVIPSPRLVPVFMDKLQTMQLLESTGVDLLGYCNPAVKRELQLFLDRYSFPIVVKARCSHGAKEVWVARSKLEMNELLGRRCDLLCQEHIDISQEYSVGVFRHGDRLHLIVLTRLMEKFGSATSYAEVSMEEDVVKYARNIAEATGLSGAFNLQIGRNNQGRLGLLEVNPRFSALVAARSMAGFKDAEWALFASLGEAPLINETSFRHLRYRRFLDELIDTGKGYHAISQWLPKRVADNGPDHRSHSV
jgi:carbamoyl-phosphate synthase large subunit